MINKQFCVVYLISYIFCIQFCESSMSSADRIQKHRRKRQEEDNCKDFLCKSGQCINNDLVCNGVANCDDQSDEDIEFCSFNSCLKTTYRCKYDACVHLSARCNGVKDCLDGSDEESCVETTTENSTNSSSSNCIIPANPPFGVYKIGINFSTIYEPGSIVPPSSVLVLSCDSAHQIHPPDRPYSFCIEAEWSPPPSTCVLSHKIALRNGSQASGWWAKPMVVPMRRVYVYNVTNADEFLNNGSKPVVEELGPYVYTETWEKKNIVFNKNGTVTYNLQKIYVFNETLSSGLEADLVVVPNIPMLSATFNAKHAPRFLRLAMASIMDILKLKPFVEVSVGQLLWGYEDPLLQLAKEVIPKEQILPYEEFGLMYNKNGTSKDKVTVFTGEADITKYGLIDTYNGMSHLTHWLGNECNSLLASDGSIFPPHISKNSTLRVYDKDLCRTLPLKFEKEIQGKDGVPSYRFTPPLDVFGSVTENPDNLCFCPHGPPCSPSGFFNVSLCEYDSPFMLSFPHFYLGNDSYRTAFDGISPPDPEKHKWYLDVQPMKGTTMSTRARIQINLVISPVPEIKQVAKFPDIIFPISWFEEVVDGIPKEVSNLMRLDIDF